MLENNVRNQKRQLLVFNTLAMTGSDNEESDVSDKKYGNRKNSVLTCQGKSKHYKKA